MHERDQPPERIKLSLKITPASKRIGERPVAGHGVASFPDRGTVRAGYVTPEGHDPDGFREPG